MTLWPTTGLWRHRDFLRLWTAQAVSAFGSRITRTALPTLAILTLGAADGDVALLGALAMAPAVLTGLIAARVIDRTRKRPLLIAADLVRAALIASIPAAAWFGVLGMPQICAVAVLEGAATALFQIADQSFLPAVVGPTLLVEGNTKLTATESIAEIAGPGLAGVLIRLLTAPGAVVVTVATYLWSAAFLSRLKVDERRDTPVESDTLDKAAGGFGAVWRNPYVRPFFVAEAVGMTGWGFFQALYMLYVLRTLGLPIDLVGVIIGVGGLGAFTGAAIAGPAVRVIGAGRAVFVFLILNMGAALFIPLAAFTGGLAPLLLVLHQLVGDAFGAAYAIQSTAMRQTATPPTMLGRVNAAFVTMHALALLSGSLIASALAGLLGIWPAVLTGVTIQLAAIPAVATPALLGLRRIEDAAYDRADV